VGRARGKEQQEPEKLYPGTVVALDLDKFEEFSKQLGLSEYEPNFVTGELTKLVEWLARKHGGFVVYGLDYERGTEEALIEFPFVKPEEIYSDLELVLKEVAKTGASVSIAVVEGMTTCKKARNRREAYYSTPWRRAAVKLLQEAKKRGGGRILVA